MFVVSSFFGNTPKSNNMSGKLSFLFDCPIICKTIIYILTNWTTALGMYSDLKGKLNAD